MTGPTDDWYWNDDLGCVMARDVADKRDGDEVEVDFYEPHIGRLAAAGPDMARALLAMLNDPECVVETEAVLEAREALAKAGVPLP